MPKNLVAFESEDNLSLSSTGKATAFAFLALLCINVALVVSGFRGPRRYEDDFLASKWALVGDPNSDQSPARWDWLIVGDSSAALGVDPDRLDDRLGGRCLNAATFGSMGIVGDVWMVERFLKNHPSPRGVIAVHAADVLSQPSGDAFYQYAASIPRPFHETVLDVAPEVPNGGQWLTLFRSGGYLPLLLVKDHLRQLIQWESTSTRVREPIAPLPFNGSSRLNADRADASKVQADALTYFADDKGTYDRFDPHHQAALERLIELAETNEFPLFFAHGPIADIVRNQAEFRVKIGPATNALKRIFQDHCQVHYLLQDWVALPHSQMENPNHPAGRAVDTYTDALADAIGESAGLQAHSIQ